jgi:hypothetical protein
MSNTVYELTTGNGVAKYEIETFAGGIASYQVVVGGRGPSSAGGGGGGSGTVTSVAISGTGLNVSGSPVTTSGTITLSVIYGTTAGTAAEGNHTHAWNTLTGTLDVLPFTTTNGGPTALGEMAWDVAEETISLQLKSGVILQLGEETLYHVENVTGSTIANGTPVSYAGTVGASGKIRVKPWNGSTDQPRAFMGIATADIVHEGTGYVTHFGKVRGINTSAFSAGAILYANPSGTGLTSTEPTANDYVIAAVVINSHATTGTLLVRSTVVSAQSTTSAPNTICKRDAFGGISAKTISMNGPAPFIAANNTTNSSGFVIAPVVSGMSFIWYDSDGIETLPKVVFSYPSDNYLNGLQIDLDSELGSDVTYRFPATSATHYIMATPRSDHQLPIDAIVDANADFTLSQSTHWRKWVRLTKSGSTQTITLPTDSSIETGCQFTFFRATSQTIAFSGGTVAGVSRLADVVQNSAFGLVYRGSGNYDFI